MRPTARRHSGEQHCSAVRGAAGRRGVDLKHNRAGQHGLLGVADPVRQRPPATVTEVRIEELLPPAIEGEGATLLGETETLALQLGEVRHGAGPHAATPALTGAAGRDQQWRITDRCDSQ